ncbi:MAG TPA: DUF2310 family Zn-ribbon-containing protein [Planctomycetota bacterium]|nr:DUF2310 family Zn-ribbon-containing protein [Planctomycetota bacterium]
MYTVEINYQINKTAKLDEQLNTLNSLLGSWRNNGQILGNQFTIVKRKCSYAVFVNIPEKISLSPQLDSKYAAKCRKNLCSTGLSKPSIKILGKDSECSKTCLCKKHSFYILFTTYISFESPLRCGDCFGVIPLYRIPKTYDDEYNDIIIWQSDYQSCDSLQMHCTVGEKFGINQISKLDSALTKVGMKVCKSIQKATKKKTYYYLYKGIGKSYRSEISRKCPSCNGNWYQKESIHDIFYFLCKKCGLLSNIAWNIKSE